jgi:hypothetical protein
VTRGVAAGDALSGEGGADSEASRLAPDLPLHRLGLTPTLSSTFAPTREGGLRAKSSSAAPWSREACRHCRREQRGVRKER